MNIREVKHTEEEIIDKVVQIHLDTFKGFFLTFIGRGFLWQMYSSYCIYKDAGLYVAFEKNQPVGFLAYSSNMSGLYKFMIKKKLLWFAWYSLGAFFRKPKVFFRLLRAFLKPGESKRAEKYVELASIGVDPHIKSKGVGSALISNLVADTDFKKFEYISLETDAINNDDVNQFYCKNGFVLQHEYSTPEGRKMNEYHYIKH